MSKKSTYQQSSAKVLRLAIVLMLLAPLIVQVFKLKKVYPLHGFQESKFEILKDSLNGTENYFDGSWQKLKSFQMQEELLLHTSAVKIRNQIDFSLFGKVNTEQMYFHQGQFFRFYCVDYHEGSIFMGEEKIKEKVAKLKAVSKILGDSIPIITAITPKKSYLYSDLLPAYNTERTELSNYRYIKKTLVQNDMHCIDFNQWFMDINDSVSAPLMGSAGIHWSQYGATLAMDSLITYLNKKTGQDFKNPNWKFSKSIEPNFHDNDVANLCNLQFPPFDKKLKNIEYLDNGKSEEKVKALIISDSYFDVISLYGLRDNIFSKDTKYDYYYGTQIGITSENQHLKPEDFLSYIWSVDCIIIMSDPVNLESYSWGFIEDAYDKLNTD